VVIALALALPVHRCKNWDIALDIALIALLFENKT
jgi:hypothetical protein